MVFISGIVIHKLFEYFMDVHSFEKGLVAFLHAFVNGQFGWEMGNTS